MTFQSFIHSPIISIANFTVPSYRDHSKKIPKRAQHASHGWETPRFKDFLKVTPLVVVEFQSQGSSESYTSAMFTGPCGFPTTALSTSCSSVSRMYSVDHLFQNLLERLDKTAPQPYRLIISGLCILISPSGVSYMLPVFEDKSRIMC